MFDFASQFSVQTINTSRRNVCKQKLNMYHMQLDLCLMSATTIYFNQFDSGNKFKVQCLKILPGKLC